MECQEGLPGVDRPSVKGKQCCGHSPWPPPVPTPDGQARPGAALHTRATVLTLPSAGAARGLLCMCGLPAGGPGETGPGQGGICQGLKAARAPARSALQSTPSPAFPEANLALCAVPGSLGDQGSFGALSLSSPCPCRARQQGGFPPSETQGGCQLISGRKEQQIAECFPDKAEVGTAASGIELTGRTSGSVGFVEEVPEKCRFSVKCIIAEQNDFCSFTG